MQSYAPRQESLSLGIDIGQALSTAGEQLGSIFNWMFSSSQTYEQQQQQQHQQDQASSEWLERLLASLLTEGPFVTKRGVENLVDRIFKLALLEALPNDDVYITLDQLRLSQTMTIMAPCMSVASSSVNGHDDEDDKDDEEKMKINRDRIIAAICSALLVTGGVAIVVVSGGVGTPGLVLATSVLINAGVSTGVLNYKLGDDFSWSEWGKCLAKNVGITLLTFGAGYACGAIVGVALTGCLSEAAVRGVGALAGSLAGAGIHGGAYFLECKMNGDTQPRWYELTLAGLGGALSGAHAGYLGSNVAHKWPASNGEPLMTVRDDQGNTFTLRTCSKDEKLGEVIKNARARKLDVDTVQRIIDNSNLRTIGKARGHSDLHALQLDPATDHIGCPARNMANSLFTSSDQQSRLVHEALLENVNKLEELKQAARVDIVYRPKHSLNPEHSCDMFLDNGTCLPLKMVKIDQIFIRLAKSGDGFLHLITAYPKHASEAASAGSCVII